MRREKARETRFWWQAARHSEACRACDRGGTKGIGSAAPVETVHCSLDDIAGEKGDMERREKERGREESKAQTHRMPASPASAVAVSAAIQKTTAAKAAAAARAIATGVAEEKGAIAGDSEGEGGKESEDGN